MKTNQPKTIKEDQELCLKEWEYTHYNRHNHLYSGAHVYEWLKKRIQKEEKVVEHDPYR